MTRGAVGGVIIGLSFMAAAVWAEPSPDLLSTYAAVQRAFLQENFTDAASRAQRFIQQHPDAVESHRVRLWLALSLDRLERSDEALQELDRLKAQMASSDSLWPEVLFWEGDISRESLRMLRAKLAYQRLLQEYPRSSWAAQAQLGLGLVYLHQQDFETAIQHFHEVELEYPDGRPALDARLFEGLCQFHLQQFADAVEILRPLLAQLNDPGTEAEAAFYLGESLNALKQPLNAIPAYERAMAAAASSQAGAWQPSLGARWGELARFGLAWVNYQLGRCDESVPLFESYLSQPNTPRRLEALFAEGSCLVALGKERDALSRFEAVVASDPAHPLAVESGMLLSEAYAKSGQRSRAQAMLEQLLSRHADPAVRARISLLSGRLALDQEEPERAEQAFELAWHSEDSSVRQAASVGLGDVGMFLGNLTGAAQRYQEAVQAAPSTSAAGYATYQLGRIQLQLGAFDEARQMFQRLAGSADQEIADEARLGLVIAELNRHDEDKARALLDIIRRDRPGSPIASRAAYYQALLALSEGDEAAARAHCDDALHGAPGTNEAFDATLLLLELRARDQSAEERTQELLALYTSSRLSRVQQAKLAKRLGDSARTAHAYANAIAWYEEAGRLVPALQAEMTYQIASCYEETGELDHAVAWYREIEQAPWKVRGFLAAARVLERQGRLAEAERFYEALAGEPIPEAKIIQERLAALRSGATRHSQAAQ